MGNISVPSSQPPNSSIEGPSGVEAQTAKHNEQQNVQPPATVPEKKRKKVEARSLVWDHFEKILDNNGVAVKAKCIYCAKVYLLTAHFIDSEWKLHKKILALVLVTSHKGEYLAKALENCLLEWGLRNVLPVTVDNASSNDTTMGFLKKKLVSWGSSTVRAKYLHMRCIAHILNLVVQDVLKDSDSSVKKSALTYQKVFESLESDCSFKSDLGNSIPDFMDWESVGSLVQLLKCFYDMTIRIFGSSYVTSNTFFTEISDLYCLLKGMVEAGGSVGEMWKNMKAKFEKYWCEFCPFCASSVSVGKPQHLLKSQIKKQRLESEGKKQTELDMYLSEAIVEEDESFDIVGWWKINSARFPVLSMLARDVIAFQSQLLPQNLPSVHLGEYWIL
ncbi:PREDICTED: zinc finger BED domain-containing protein RICESLEEPER 2-like [Ipomoea nil]|uniref:zinc finger BED domain-containing protein RICESLEEPER 2-like n=1 Tax=Ipomoea nil TaxID=35883 RepID=UPI0009008DB9|nr:PREDICTED: zinc finger BED domain-containing protein RICESLEEPER 2-like [Ipomoea nil]